MKKSLAVLALLFFGIMSVQAQLTQLNDYKYVIVENQFHFQNEPGEYNLNRMVKFLFEKHGFDAILEGDPLPDDLKQNYCLALNADIQSKGALWTKAWVNMRDCDGNLVYVSPEGKTKVKEFDRAYDLAIRDAFENFATLNYQYVPNERITSQGASSEIAQSEAAAQQEIAELKAELDELKKEKEEKKAESQKENFKMQKSNNELVKKVDPQYMVIQEGDVLVVQDQNNKAVMVLIPSGRPDLFMVKDKKCGSLPRGWDVDLLRNGGWQTHYQNH